MAICDTCGNHYDKSFTVTFSDGRTATFDSVECAAVQLAPECAHCGAGFWDMAWRHPTPSSAAPTARVRTPTLMSTTAIRCPQEA